MSIRRVAIIFDDTARPETTGVYCRRALEQLVEVEHFLPTELARMPQDEFDLYLFIDDGLRFPIPTKLGRSAYWAIDTHLDLNWACQRGWQVDLLFAAQRDGAAQLRERGFPGATWLPLACDPEIHRKHELPKRHDVTFVGTMVAGPRTELVELLQQEFPNSFAGQRYFEDMARKYSESRIVFNQSILNDINMRVFEALSCGSLLLTNDLSENGLADLFHEGTHLATYGSREELLEKAHYYIDHEDIRERIAEAGRAEVLAKHTYVHRMRTILDAAEQMSKQGSTVVPKMQAELVRKKDWSYFEYARPEVVALVPETARRILDVGCSAGRLGASIKARQQATVSGIELNPDAAATARERIDRVFEGNVESVEIDFPDESFDCIICADVLEHIHDPRRVLAKLRRWLTPDGSLVMSIPNARHHSILQQLRGGNFTYESAGLLDDTHLQFWTWRDFRKLLDRVGFSISEQQFVPGSEFEEWRRQGQQDRIIEGALRLEGLPPGEAEHFHAYQYLFRAIPIRRPEYSLTSIVIVTHNQWHYTEQCLASLKATTDEPYELIVVDNGSTDKTVEELRRRKEVTLIVNSENRGFPAAVNQGIQAAQGEQIVLLNNDVLLTTGWLRRMLDALRSSPEIGLVGPCTNCTAGTQRVRDAGYPLLELDDFAARWAEVRRGRRQIVPELTGFCLLLRREVVERVGLLDERFGIGIYEDVDYALRSVQAGFQLVIAEDVFVHHFGHRSFLGAGLEQDGLAERNRQLFLEKWAGVASPILDAETAPKTPAALFAHKRENTESPNDEMANLLTSIPSTSSRILLVGSRMQEWADAIKARTGQSVSVLTETALNEPVADNDDSDLTLTTEVRPGGLHQEPFDYVIWPTLSESADPGNCLDQIRKRLASNGTLLVSVPNICRPSVVTALIRGTWSPAPLGSEERSLRFYTRREIEKLLFRRGLEVQSLKHCTDLFHSEAPKRESSPPVIGSPGNCSPNAVEDSTADRYLIAATPAPTVSDSLTSIILVTFNEFRYTRACIESLRLRTDEPYELIVVDNGSTDETVAYLQSAGDVTLIRNSENRGFPAAANQGIRAAKGENILLLNNDTLVTTGWLRRMLDVLQRDPRVGLVGPCSNRCSGPQEISVGYERIHALDGFAWDWGKAHVRETIEIDRLVGFCLLFRRAVVDRIGFLDERFGIGNFEDDDFCRRGIAAGFKAVIAVDAFIHHFGSRTFLASGVDFGGLLEENRRKYEAKWNARADSGANSNLIRGAQSEVKNIPRLSVTSSSSGGLLLARNQVRLSLCMIVRDNETTIGPCLESIRPYVDEIIVVDTGSKDRTPAICRKYGARLHKFPWCDDFSAARNESLRYARGEWIFWMDSDDTITAECGQKLRALVDGSHALDTLGYVMQVHCPGPGDDGHRDVTVVDHVKLFRNNSELRFEGRIHEQVLPSIRRLAGEVGWTDLYVVHSGSDHSEEAWDRKLARDLRILHRELDEKPTHPFVLFNLGMTYADAEEYDEAIGYLKRCLAVSQPEESHLRKAYALLVSSLSQANRHDEAWDFSEKGLRHYPGDKELLFRSAMLSHHFGNLREAERTYLRVLNESEERHFTSVDLGLASYKARHNLALVYEEMGRLDDAERQWRQITGEVSDYTPAWRALGDILLRKRDYPAIERLITQLFSASPSHRREGHLLEGRWAMVEGQHSRAIRNFQTADEMDRGEFEPLRQLCRLYFELDDLPQAEARLRELTERAPEDPSAWHNLGTVNYRRKDLVAAINAYRKSLAYRPDRIDTWVQLGCALRDAGRNKEASECWRHVLEREPNHPTAVAELEAAIPMEPAAAGN